MQLIKNRGISVLTKSDHGEQLRIMQGLKMHETNKSALGGAFRLNQSLKDAQDQRLDKRFSSQTELSKYSSSILPMLQSNRKNYDDHISNIDPHKELSKAISNFRQ